ncbi:helix-turn-helix domain-containing protein [Nocardiopsis sp. LOL_012]|uniref:helix-turn-helix domain-containing protein n=1 Tax=Nocardiopsis sp. LOL_012 TaxID=3345409 RepID=UPI003A8A20AE
MQAALKRTDVAEVIRILRHSVPSLTQERIGCMTDLSQSTVSRIESGRSRLGQARSHDVLTALGAPLPTPHPPTAPVPAPPTPPARNHAHNDSERLHQAAQDPESVLSGLADTVDDLTLTTLEAQLSALAVAYVSQPLPGIVPRIIATRDAALAHHRTGARPRQAHHLIVISGTASLLLAHAAQNLGHTPAALNHLAIAERCATYADYPPLTAWIHGTRALFAEWEPDVGDAVHLAGHAIATATSTEERVRAHAIKARAAARRGDADTAHAALTALDHHRSTSTNTGPGELGQRFGGIFTFPRAKTAFYTGSTHLMLGDADTALELSQQAITDYTQGPTLQRSYGDHALAHIDRAAALLHLGDTDSVRADLLTLTRLPPELRIRQLGPAVHSLRGRLHQAPIRDADRIDLNELIIDFTRTQGPIPLGP